MSTRFAPSPTGQLHLGHVYAAKFAYDLAQKTNTEFLLRFEDIDLTRVKDEYYLEIERDLTWLGLNWNGKPLRQRERFPLYAQALEKLKAREVVYPCFCTRREIQRDIKTMGEAPHSDDNSKNSQYPGTCKVLTPQQRQAKIDTGAPHCWRLDAKAAADQTGKIYFEDSIYGKTQVNHKLLGDVILARKDITTSYHIAVVIDDAMQQITDVSRGADLLTSTHVHCLLQNLLELPTPCYHHHRLILDDQDKRLAKRNHTQSIKTLRGQNKTAAEVIAMVT